MKKSDIYRIQEGFLINELESKKIRIKEIYSMELKIVPCLKKETDEILNTMANALSQSAGNGNEWVWVQLVIQYGDHNKSVFCLQEEPVVRFNLEYHELVDRTRKLEAILKKEIGMIL